MLSEIVISTTARILTVIAVLSQSVAKPMPLRIGTARVVSEKDYLNLEKVLPKREKPWLLMGDPGQIQLVTFNVYLSATKGTSELRRGAMVIASQLKPPSWRVDGKDPCCMAWAQVAFEERDFADIHDLNDPNRPFRVIGAFSDAELLSLVRTLRSSDEISQRLRVISAPRKLPILSVARGPRNESKNTAEAFLHIDDARNSVARILLRKDAEQWRVVDVSWGTP